MLLVDAPLWRIAEKLEISEATIRRNYKHVLAEFEDRTSGPKPHVPSPATRNHVKLLAISGATRDDITRVTGIGPRQLSENYREELETALIESNAKVAGNLLMMATGPREHKTTVTAAIWWTKARMGWKDTSRVENTGADGGPLQVENQIVVVLPDNGRSTPLIEGSTEASDDDDDDTPDDTLMLQTTSPETDDEPDENDP